jgi:hypothetical protein
MDLLRSTLPDLVANAGRDVEGLVPVVSALIERAAFDDADRILQAVAAAPAHYPGFEAYAMSAFHHRNFADQATRWRMAITAVWIRTARRGTCPR